MATSIPYLTMRNGDYHYYRRIPADIQKIDGYELVLGAKRFYQRSLSTNNLTKALEQMRLIEADYNLRISKVSQSADNIKLVPLKQLTQRYLDKIEKDRFESVAGPFREAYLLSDFNELDLKYFEHRIGQLEEQAAEIKRAVKSQGYESTNPLLPNPGEQARQLICDLHLDVDYSSSEFGYVVAAVRAGLLSGYDFAFKLAAGDLKPQEIKASSVLQKAPSFTLRDAVNKHLEFREFPARTKTEFWKVLRDFENIIGVKLLEEISKDDVRKFVIAIGQRVIGTKDKSSVERRISPATVKKAIRLLASAVERSIELVPNELNVFHAIDVSNYVPPQSTQKIPTKRPFKVDELNKLMEYPWFSGCKPQHQIDVKGKHLLRNSYFWVPMVALFSGCRAAELGGMMVSEVMLEPGQIHPHFKITPNKFRGIKNGKTRLVPINTHLIMLGFGDYLSERKKNEDERLFPDWEPSRTVSSTTGTKDYGWSNGKLIRAFNRTLLNHVLPVQPNSRSPVTFHSFRGSFKSMLGLSVNAIPNNVINEVIGHAKSALDQAYVGTVPLEETFPHIREAKFNGLKLPPSRGSDLLKS